MATTVRCPECQRKNRIPAGAADKARCGACRAPLMPGGGASAASGPSSFGGPSPFGTPSDSGVPPGFLGAPGAGGPGGVGAPWGGGGDATGARMRQTRRSARTASTGSTGPAGFGGGAPPGDPRGTLMQRWDEVLRLVPPDMGLTAALGQGTQGPAGNPISWLSAAANVPREDLEQVRRVRNSLASNRPVADNVISSALETLDRVIAVVGMHPPG